MLDIPGCRFGGMIAYADSSSLAGISYKYISENYAVVLARRLSPSALLSTTERHVSGYVDLSTALTIAPVW